MYANNGRIRASWLRLFDHTRSVVVNGSFMITKLLVKYETEQMTVGGNIKEQIIVEFVRL